MLLQQSSIQTLHSLRLLIEGLTNEEYAQELSVFSGSSIGKHVRHILEFYECLFQNMAKGQVNYDARQRNLQLETNREFSLETLEKVTRQIQGVAQDVSMQLQVSMESDELSVVVPTTLYRELVYNIEHCIHHLALIRVGVQTSFSHIALPAQLGVAYSTVRYHQTKA